MATRGKREESICGKGEACPWRMRISLKFTANIMNEIVLITFTIFTIPSPSGVRPEEGQRQALIRIRDGLCLIKSLC